MFCSQHSRRLIILIAVSILFNLLRNISSGISKYMYIKYFGAVFALFNHNPNVLPQAWQRAVRQNHFLLLINITLEKIPHACYLKSTFTKENSLEQKITILNVVLLFVFSTSCRKNRYTPFLLNYRINLSILEAPSFFMYIKNRVVSK